ncbi:MAG: molybdopterin-dependent oxidoreductase [Gammaproteobacteria bacterium]|nr:molybdopterin-dependent oxidoreductase [Gammaproteobacteria bacterium]
MQHAARQQPDLTPPTDGEVRGVCPHDCADGCSIVAEVRAGRVVRVRGNADHPVTRGFICRKYARAPQHAYAATRLRHPLRRTGPKGTGEFERIGWDDALAIIAGRWRSILAQDGPCAILPFFGSGTEGIVHGHLAGRRFFNRLGTLQLDRTICTKAGRTGYRYTMGTSMGADPQAADAATLIMTWGANLATTNVHQVPVLARARRRGAVHVIVDPRRPQRLEADELVQPRPGTDAALALGIMHVLIDERLYDADFVARHTVGFEALRARAAEYPPGRVARICDIPAATVRSLARLYARHPRSFIYVGPGCQRHTNGGMTLRTLACLPALTGAWRHRGCGLYFPTSTVFPVDLGPLEGEALRPSPPARYNMLELARLLESAENPIRSLYVFQGNPATVLYNQQRLRRELAREELFTVVHEQVLTDTARYADIVLPATTQLEQLDLHVSYYHFGVQLNRPAIAPIGEARSNLDTFAALAAALGLDEPELAIGARELVERVLALGDPALAGIDLATLAERGWCRARLADIPGLLDGGALPTPSGHIELYSQTMATRGLDPLPAWEPIAEGPEATPELYARYPLQMLTPSGAGMLNSAYAQHAAATRGPALAIHPLDAAARGIGDGDRVRVFNTRGACVLAAEVGEHVRPGVVASAGLWWSARYPNGCTGNHLTPDFLETMAGGSAFNSNLVEVERCPPP